MRSIVIAALSMTLGLAVPSAHGQNLDAASSEALAATLEMLTDPSQRAGAIAGNSDARAVDQKIRSLTGSDQLTEELYGLAAQILADLGRSQGRHVGQLRKRAARAFEHALGLVQSDLGAQQLGIHGVLGLVVGE